MKKNNRWILGLIIITILITTFLILDYKNSKIPLKTTAGTVSEKCNAVSLETAIENIKILPEVTEKLSVYPGVKGEIGYNLAFENIADVNDPHHHIRVFESQKSLSNPPKTGSYMQQTFNVYVVDKCTGKPITSHWLFDKNGDPVSYDENPDFLKQDAQGNYNNDDFKQTIF